MRAKKDYIEADYVEIKTKAELEAEAKLDFLELTLQRIKKRKLS